VLILCAVLARATSVVFHSVGIKLLFSKIYSLQSNTATSVSQSQSQWTCTVLVFYFFFARALRTTLKSNFLYTTSLLLLPPLLLPFHSHCYQPYFHLKIATIQRKIQPVKITIHSHFSPDLNLLKKNSGHSLKFLTQLLKFLTPTIQANYYQFQSSCHTFTYGSAFFPTSDTLFFFTRTSPPHLILQHTPNLHISL